MRKTFTLGMVIILLSNGFIFARVIINRYMGDSASLNLSERELTVPYRYNSNREDSSLFLNLNWRTVNTKEYYSYRKNFEISLNKLQELGFKAYVNNEERKFNRQSKKEVYFLLEFDGPAYKTVLKKRRGDVEKAKKEYKLNNNKENKTKLKDSIEQLTRDENKLSRLFVIDVSQDKNELIEKINSDSYIVTKGIVEPSYRYQNTKNNNKKTYSLDLLKLSVKKLNIPLALSKNIRNKGKSKKELKLKVRVRWGSLAEPWIVDLKAEIAK